MKIGGELKSIQDKHQTSPTGNIERGPLSKESLKVTDQKGTETIYSNSHFTGNTMTLNSYLSIVTLNVNELNASIKRHRVSEWIKKQNPSICCLQETHLDPDTSRFKVRGCKTIYHVNGHQEKPGVPIPISDQLDFKSKTVMRNEEGHYITMEVPQKVENRATL